MKSLPTKHELKIIEQAISEAVKVALDHLGDGWKKLSFLDESQIETKKQDAA